MENTELVKKLREKAGAFDYDGRPDIACDYEQAADAIEQLTEDNAALNGTVTNLLEQIKDFDKPHWIPVEEKLPEQPGDYIVFLKSPKRIREQWLEYGFDDDGSYCTIAFYNDSQRIWEMENDAYNTDLGKVDMSDDYAITHWVPLPEPPKEETE